MKSPIFGSEFMSAITDLLGAEADSLL
ncbi:MAG: hypothetical protein RLZZ461_864, partial [Planctomycetota bacterium]